jgi:glycerol uptake facilitator-like aquaporin
MFVKLFVSEFVGTFMFLGTIFSVLQQNTFNSLTPLVIGAGLSTSIVMLGSVSGGHFNPAVTLMDFTASKMNYWIEPIGHVSTVPKMLTYISAQILGGQCALFTLRYIVHGINLPTLDIDDEQYVIPDESI